MSATVVTSEGNLRCSARHGESGVVVWTDAPKDHHGNGESFSPSDLLSVSLGSCILSIMELAARSIGVDIGGSTAEVEKTMANGPRRIAGISVKVHVPHDLEPEQIRKLEAAAHACPVHGCLDPAMETPITLVCCAARA